MIEVFATKVLDLVVVFELSEAHAARQVFYREDWLQTGIARLFFLYHTGIGSRAHTPRVTTVREAHSWDASSRLTPLQLFTPQDIALAGELEPFIDPINKKIPCAANGECANYESGIFADCYHIPEPMLKGV